MVLLIQSDNPNPYYWSLEIRLVMFLGFRTIFSLKVAELLSQKPLKNGLIVKVFDEIFMFSTTWRHLELLSFRMDSLKMDLKNPQLYLFPFFWSASLCKTVWSLTETISRRGSLFFIYFLGNEQRARVYTDLFCNLRFYLDHSWYGMLCHRLQG